MRRAEREAYRQFATPACHGSSKDAEQAHPGQEQRTDTEPAHEHGADALAAARLGDDLVQCPHLRDGDPPLDVADGPANVANECSRIARGSDHEIPVTPAP